MATQHPPTQTFCALWEWVAAQVHTGLTRQQHTSLARLLPWAMLPLGPAPPNCSGMDAWVDAILQSINRVLYPILCTSCYAFHPVDVRHPMWWTGPQPVHPPVRTLT